MSTRHRRRGSVSGPSSGYGSSGAGGSETSTANKVATHRLIAQGLEQHLAYGPNADMSVVPYEEATQYANGALGIGIDDMEEFEFGAAHQALVATVGAELAHLCTIKGTANARGGSAFEVQVPGDLAARHAAQYHAQQQQRMWAWSAHQQQGAGAAASSPQQQGATNGRSYTAPLAVSLLLTLAVALLVTFLLYPDVLDPLLPRWETTTAEAATTAAAAAAADPASPRLLH